MKNFARLFEYAKGSRLLLTAGIFGGAIERCIAAFLTAALFGRAIDLAPQGMEPAAAVIGKAVPALAVLMALHGFSRFAREKACARSAARLRQAVMERALGSTLESMRHVESARILTALSSDVGAAFESMASVLVVPAAAVMLGISGLLYIAGMDTVLGAAVLFMAFFQAAYSFALAGRMHLAGSSLLTARAKTCTNLQETMEGIVQVRMDNLTPRMRSMFLENGEEERAQAVRYGSLSGLTGGINNGVSQTEEKILLLISGLLAVGGRVSMGQMMEVSQLAGNVIGVCNVSRVLTDTQMASAGAERVFQLLETLKKEPDGEETVERHDFPSIEAKAMTFAYPGKKPVIRSAEFTLRAGSIVLLKGESGSGKTTLLRLIQAMELPTEGTLLVCGVETAKWKRKALRRHIAYVPQTPVFFQGTVLENLLNGEMDAGEAKDLQGPKGLVSQGQNSQGQDSQGQNSQGQDSQGQDPQGTDPRVMRSLAVQAAEKARIHERIMALEKGYDTYLADAGSILSGGELQRLALARALCRGADILVLDEPTSALDVENETLLYQVIEACKAGRIVILCSHRQSAERIADWVLRLEEGKITPDHLRLTR